jgi:thioredoxin 1
MTSKTTTSQYFYNHIYLFLFKHNKIINWIVTLFEIVAEWCGPCKMVGPIVEQLAYSLDGKVKVSNLNVDQNEEIAVKYNIQSIPSLVLFKNGNEIARMVGVSPKEKYEAFVNNALNS